ncbi:hypothetical protein Acr_11g0010300 [Actinidia rufa]|uniref:Uncharacterized protein n=1 Tax=Actinidia rufa TaxID=165716 RepID=A0A7J0FDE6_9ERIC|nr:hypothetical protein Acr_11g0010300 [Actinidia rufa]
MLARGGLRWGGGEEGEIAAWRGAVICFGDNMNVEVEAEAVVWWSKREKSEIEKCGTCAGGGSGLCFETEAVVGRKKRRE